MAYDKPETLRSKMMHGMSVPYPILYDAEKTAYRRWGMGRTTLRRSVISPRLTARYLKLLLRGERFLGFAPDMLQLGGDFVVGRDGGLAFAHRMHDNGDRTAVPVLVEALRREAER